MTKLNRKVSPRNYPTQRPASYPRRIRGRSSTNLSQRRALNKNPMNRSNASPSPVQFARPTPYPKPAFGRAARAVASIGIGAARNINPYWRLSKLAFDIAYEIPWENPWFVRDKGEAEGYDFSKFPWDGWNKASDWVDCFNPTLPWTGNGGTGGTDWPSTPGGNCSGGYTDPNSWFGDGPPEDLADISLEWGMVGSTRRWRYRAVEMGPANGRESWHRHAQKLKVVRSLWQNNVGNMEIPYPRGIRIPLIRVNPKSVPVPRAVPPPAAIVHTTNGVSPLPRLRPYERPGIEWTPNTGARPRPHQLRRPNDGEGEKKRRVNPGLAAKLIAALYNGTTEASQIVDILYDNLGRKCRGAKSMSEKANCVYRNLGTLDIDAAIGDLIANHLMDKYIYGKIFGTVGKHTPYGSLLPGSKPTRTILF